MRFYYRLADPSLAAWMMMLKRRLVSIYKAGVHSYDRWMFTSAFTAQMRIQGKSLYVGVTAAVAAYFEFQTSGFPAEFNGTFGSSPIYKPCVIGVEVRADGTLVPTSTLLGGQHTNLAADVSLVGRINQVQLLNEPVTYPGAPSVFGGYPKTLFEAYPPVDSHTGVYTRSIHCNYLPNYTFVPGVSVRAHQQRDTGYDATWAQGNARTKLVSAYLTDDTYDWARASGIQSVTDETFGKREFAIIIDAFDQVTVFPTSAIGVEVPAGPFAPTQNVDALNIRMQRITLPTWVFAKTQTFKSFWNPLDASNTGLTEFPEIDWKVSADGTKCAAVVHERVEAAFNSSFYGPYSVDTGTQGPSQFYPTAASFYSLVSQACGWPPQAIGQYPSVSTDKWYHAAPGIIEVAITITLTGPDPSQFSIALTVTEVRRPTTSPYCPVVVGYCYHSVSGKADRGDLLALDVECYGDPVGGYTGQLWSLKNLTQATEVDTFGATSTHVDNTFAAGRPATEECFLTAYDMSTMSFVFKHQGAEIIDYGVDRFGNPKQTKTMHFVLGVRVMGVLKEVLYPNLMSLPNRAILADYAKNGTRATLLAAFPGLVYMPLNDLRDWSNTDMQSLREDYARDNGPSGTYTPGFNALQNYAEIETKGHLYYKATRDYPVPTAAANIWYNNLMGQNGLRPFPMFYCTEPRPGWYLYAREIISKLYLHANSTFFAHPNGTFALFDQQFIYNANPMFGPYVDPLQDKLIGSTVADLNVAKLEHCIFDRVHFELPIGANATGSLKLDTTFLALYNGAIERGLRLGTIKDDTVDLAPDYSSIRAQLSVNTVVDSFDSTLSYAQLQLDWYPGFRAYMTETGYFNGKKDFSIGFESQPNGRLLNCSLGTWWDDSTLSFLIDPLLFNGQQVTFSTCLLITK